jgi:predicted ArsR family transcriptional regulator
MDGKHRRVSTRPRLFGTTRGRVLVLLCRGRQTVAELARALGITNNAIRAQLQRLHRDGLARQAGSRKGVRKPHAEYELTAKALELFPRVYEPFLQTLVDELSDRLPEPVWQGLIAEAGRRLLTQLVVPGKSPARSPRQRLASSLSRLNGSTLGFEMMDVGSKTVIRSCSCPLATVTAAHPEVCQVFASVLSEILGGDVQERCEKGKSPRCSFELAHARQAP